MPRLKRYCEEGKKLKIEKTAQKDCIALNTVETSIATAVAFPSLHRDPLDEIDEQIQVQKDKNYLNQFDLLDDIIFSSTLGNGASCNTNSAAGSNSTESSICLAPHKPSADLRSSSELKISALPPSGSLSIPKYFEKIPTKETVGEGKQQTAKWKSCVSTSSNTLVGTNEQLQVHDDVLVEKIVNSITTDDQLNFAINEIIENLKAINGGNGTPKGMRIVLMPHQLKGLAWMMKMEADPEYRGGILADDMGLGKTVQTLALIHQNRLPLTDRGCNLIVAPLALIRQWEREILSKTKMDSECRLRVIVHHGKTKASSLAELLNFDIVITTYALLTGDCPMQKSTPMFNQSYTTSAGLLFQAKFRRVILDEVKADLSKAQIIKNSDSKASQVCGKIGNIADIKFALSGTPIQNSVSDIYPLFRFLGHPVFSDRATFNREIASRVKLDDPETSALALMQLQAILMGCMLRRTKHTKDSTGISIIHLPPRRTHVVSLNFPKSEQAFYNAIEQNVILQFKDLQEKNIVMKNYSSVLVLLLRLRQAACHPHLLREIWEYADKGLYNISTLNLVAQNLNSCKELTIQLKAVKKKMKHKAFKRLYEMAADGSLPLHECPICFDVMPNPYEELVITPSCGHMFCSDCFSTIPLEADEKSVSCPNCRETIVCKNMISASVFDLTAESDPMQMIQNDSISPDDFEMILKTLHPDGKYLSWISSAKINKMIEILIETRERDSHIKTVIFSQFTSLLSQAARALEIHEFKAVVYTGAMPNGIREEILTSFRENSRIDVILVSLKAGGVGLNLTCASQVIMLDLWWNPAVEDQAIDRVHRIGQLNSVDVYRLTVANTVEERLLMIQEQKRNIADGALGDGAKKIAKLSEDDLKFLFTPARKVDDTILDFF